MTSYKDLLPKRIPESEQNKENLLTYLEVCGELFDAYVDAIEGFDDYKDPVNVSKDRLQYLASEFAMTFPRNIGEDLQRTIIRDLEAIYQKNGGVDVINWIFRLIGWDVSLDYAWVMNPEYYDPAVVDVFNLSDYGQTKSPPVITDFYRRDYRSFLLGEEYVFDNGTYFRGRRFFDKRDTFLKNEIVGEYYESDKTRTVDKVMSTPYLFIRVSEETYNIFISPYVDEETGEVFSYTDVEFFDVVQNIFDFFMLNVNRPSNVRVVIIVAPQFLEDVGVLTSDYSDEYTASPADLKDTGIVTDPDNSYLVHEAQVGSTFMAGTPPSPFQKEMVINPIAFRNLTGFDMSGEIFYYVDHNDNYYQTRTVEKDYLGPRCGALDWTFVTPHEESFAFRNVYMNKDTKVDTTSTTGADDVYEDDRDSLRMCVDFTTDSFGIYDEAADTSMTIRNSTSVNSYAFNESTKPANAFELGNTVTLPGGEEEFDHNIHIAMDFRENGELKSDETDKSFWYVYDMKFYYKESRLDGSWDLLVDNPTKGDLNTLTNANALAPVFNKPVPYDFELEVEYHEQPHWENRTS